MEAELIERVQQAIAARTPLCIVGGGSKSFYGRSCHGEPLNLSGHRGIVAYEPSELVITARAGTPLAEIEAALAANNQILPFEPPHFSQTATLGGMVAAGLSGPRRPWGGSVRDAVLGVKLLNGRGEVLRLGGQVMKNVAGYDVSRLMVGALGTLGVLLEVSLKVLPRPACERTLIFENACWKSAAQLPISASLEVEGLRYLRLSGGSRCIELAAAQLGGNEADPAVWNAVRDQTHPYFNNKLPLWRISLPTAAPSLNLPGSEMIEWNGAQRWLFTDLSGKALRQRVQALGGHATLFRGHHGANNVFHPLPPAMLAMHQRIKLALDPHGIFNPGRLYADL
jgi:glycolate oxidase FAD binding subunit